jgi:hypothetical protein
MVADCSGAVSDLVEVITTGQTTPGRLFSTSNEGAELAKRGFQPGYQPGALNVGFKNGGPGGGHTAATLPNGVNFESGGSHGGIAYGGPAAGANDPQFTDHWYLPVGAGGVPGAGAAQQWSPGIPAVGGGTAGGSTPGYQPTQQPQAAPSWQSGAKSAGGGGLVGGALTAAAGMFPGGGAAASMMLQMITRTIQYGGEIAGSLAKGGLDALSVSDPDGGPGASLGDSWLGRLAGSIASAQPALPSSAGKQDKQQQSAVDPNTTQHGQGKCAAPGPGVHIENFVQSPDRQGASKTANDLAYATAAAGMIPV